jgi:hypothetical protein
MLPCGDGRFSEIRGTGRNETKRVKLGGRVAGQGETSGKIEQPSRRPPTTLNEEVGRLSHQTDKPAT